VKTDLSNYPCFDAEGFLRNLASEGCRALGLEAPALFSTGVKGFEVNEPIDLGERQLRSALAERSFGCRRDADKRVRGGIGERRIVVPVPGHDAENY